MCAPGDQGKSSDNQAEQVELNARQCRRGPKFREGRDLGQQAANLRRSCAEESVRRMGGYGTAAHGTKAVADRGRDH